MKRDFLDEDFSRREAKKRRAEILADLALVLELPEAERVFARILRDLGLGRAIEPSELTGRCYALSLFQDLREANPKAALEINKMVFGLKI